MNINLETIISPKKMVGKYIADYKTRTYIAYDSETDTELCCVLDDETNELELVVVKNSKIVYKI